MNLDKHDLFRNAVPGFVFLVVILSFYAVAGRLEEVNKGQHALIGLVTGFPLGFIIHSLYRIVFHVWSGERDSIDREEAKLVSDRQLKGSDREKAHYVWLELYKPENSNWKERVGFLYSYIHALGASVLAITLALLFILTLKIPAFLYSAGLLRLVLVFLTALIWVAIAIVFYIGRRDAKETARISVSVLLSGK